MKFSQEENVTIFCQNCEIRFHIWLQKSFSLDYVFLRLSIHSFIRLINNSIIYTETILKITTKVFETFSLRKRWNWIPWNFQRSRKLILARSLWKPNLRKSISAKSLEKPKWRKLTTVKCLKKEFARISSCEYIL